MKDSASVHYILLRNSLDNHASLAEINELSDSYKIYRTECLNRLKTKKEKDAFIAWIVSEYKKGHAD